MKNWFTSSKLPVNTMSRAFGSSGRTIVSGWNVRFSTTIGAVTLAANARISSSLCAPGWPTIFATGKLGMPRPTAVAAACARNPSQVSEEVGKPARSHASLARNTAGVHEPQHAMQDMAASTPNSLNRCGSEASSSFSFTAWVEPNSRQLTHCKSG